MPAGRPPKPTQLLRVHGGLQKGRHDDRIYEPRPEGDAKQTIELAGEALEAWSHLWPRLAKLGLATELDSHELTAMCQWWAKFQEYYALDQVNKMTMAYKQFRAIAAKFGLTPTDRVGLKGANLTPTDELADLIA